MHTLGGGPMQLTCAERCPCIVDTSGLAITERCKGKAVEDPEVKDRDLLTHVGHPAPRLHALEQSRTCVAEAGRGEIKQEQPLRRGMHIPSLTNNNEISLAELVPGSAMRAKGRTQKAGG